MYQLAITEYLLIALSLWLAILSFFLVKTLSHYRKLTRGATNIDFATLIETIIKRSEVQEENIGKLTKELSDFKNKAQAFLQKFSLIRFNPFEDAGGDQSFVVTFMDAKNNGVVISSLHSRTGVRVYAKNVEDAKPVKHQFTKEEKEAVEKAARHV